MNSLISPALSPDLLPVNPLRLGKLNIPRGRVTKCGRLNFSRLFGTLCGAQGERETVAALARWSNHKRAGTCRLLVFLIVRCSPPHPLHYLHPGVLNLNSLLCKTIWRCRLLNHPGRDWDGRNIFYHPLLLQYLGAVISRTRNPVSKLIKRD